jgi:hypothetical protein
MEIITIDNVNYILSDYILSNAPIYSKGCRSTRDLIRQRKIEPTKYIYVRWFNNKWIKSDGKSMKYDKIIINEDIIKTIPEINPELNENNNQVINDNNGIEKAPDIINLNDDEKFKDDEGNILEIETRGERKVNNIYFRVKDISNKFNKEYLQNDIIKEHTIYKDNIDYKFFICKKKDNHLNNKTSKYILKKELFLTYEGLLRFLFVSRNGKTTHFIKWAIEKLFIIQMGTKEQKQKLSGDILGVNAKVIKEVFNCDANSIPCIYLFTLGYVKDLRESMKIDNNYDDNSIVAKYGMTKKLSRRTTEHITNYNKINGCNLKLKYYSYVDPQYISTGENDMKEFINSLELKMTYNNEEELIIIPNKFLKIIAEKYEHIGKKYSGHISELITKIKELEDIIEKQELKHNLEKQTLIHNLDLQKEKYQHELLKKDYEILILQNKLNK